MKDKGISFNPELWPLKSWALSTDELLRILHYAVNKKFAMRKVDGRLRSEVLAYAHSRVEALVDIGAIRRPEFVSVTLAEDGRSFEVDLR